MSDKLEPMPEPTTEEPELIPGGIDALPDEPGDHGLGRDLGPEDNPAVDDVLPDEVAERDDGKSQSPDGKADDRESGTKRSDGADESEAGQQAEDGSVEPPA